MSGRFLFVTWEGSGNLPPALAAARSLAGRGHAVRFLGHASQRDRTAFPFTAYRSVPDLYERVPIPPDPVWWEELFLAQPPGRELLEELERRPADAVVVDCLLWGALAAAERARIPAAVFVHSVYGRRFAAEDLPERLPAHNRSRVALGLSEVSSLLEPWEGARLVLVASARCLHPANEPPPANVLYAGPLREPDARGTGRADLPWAGDVLVSFSTSRLAMARTTQRVLDALEPLPLRCLVTSSADGLKAGPNAFIRAWVPHDSVLPRASLAISHGGHGTVTAALRHGVPVLALPLVADQPFVAALVEDAGAGLSLPPTSSLDEIRSAVQEILAAPSYRDAARRLALDIGHELEAAAHVPALESLLR